jgi:hypothetical protein
MPCLSVLLIVKRSVSYDPMSNSDNIVGDRRQATGDRRQATGDRRQATGDRRQATGDRRNGGMA